MLDIKIDLFAGFLELLSQFFICMRLTSKKYKSLKYPSISILITLISSELINFLFPNVFGWIIFFPIHYFIFLYAFNVSKFEMFIAFTLSYCYLTATEDIIALFFFARLNTLTESQQAIIGSTLTLCLIIASGFILPLNKIYKLILNGSTFIKFTIIHITLLIIIEIGLHKFSNYDTTIILSLILSFAVVIIITDYLLIKQQRTIARQQESLENYQTYEPMMDSLIEDIRRRQHDFSNELNAINMISCTYNNYESLSHALNEHAEHLSRDFHSTDLVHLNMKVLAGFLHSKKANALAEKKDLDIKINSYVLNSQMPEYELIKVVGILIDNALEATDENGTVKLEIGSRDDRLTFATVNKGPKLTPKLRSDMVKAGYTTKEPACSDKTIGKRKRPAKRGYGLANALELLKEYGGELYIENPESDGGTLIRFEFIV